jgi:hypothetical protein
MEATVWIQIEDTTVYASKGLQAAIAQTILMDVHQILVDCMETVQTKSMGIFAPVLMAIVVKPVRFLTTLVESYAFMVVHQSLMLIPSTATALLDIQETIVKTTLMTV